MSFLYPLTGLASAVQQSKIPWGITIYRTTYTPLSNTHFDKIIEIISALLKDSIRSDEEIADDDNGSEKRTAYNTLKEYYQPIVMNDRTRYDGMTLEDVRAHYQTYLERPEGTGMSERPYTNENLCFVIDDEVVTVLADLCVWLDSHKAIKLEEGCRTNRSFSSLENMVKWWLKGVEADVFVEGDKGWLKCSVFALWSLWVDMCSEEGMSTWEAMADNDEGVYWG
ncbi:hypothetical protein BDW68DRAFT_168021 [Aspergillus falconensis]